MTSQKHNELSETAIRWLYGRGCSVFANEVPTCNGIADAIGVITSQRMYGKDDVVYYIEAKASRSDLVCLKQRAAYQRTQYSPHHDNHGNYIDFFYLIVADGVKVEPTLYPSWGVINEGGRVIRKAKNMKKKNYDTRDLLTNIAHVLVYKVHGKLYLP